MKKYSKEDQRLMATWAADCAERTLSLFEDVAPNDMRPRRAIEVCREWIRTGIFSMPVIRGASLAAHAAAKDVKENDAACFAAHAAGQAVATAHVPQHAYGSPYYALKAVSASDSVNAEINIKKELDWQSENLPKHLSSEIMSRIIVEKCNGEFFFKIKKDADF